MANKFWVGGAGNWLGTYTSNYLSAYNTSIVKTTGEWSTDYSGWRAYDPTRSLTAGMATNQWLGGTTTNQRFHIDLGSEKTVTKIYYENGYDGATINMGVQNFTFWGSNTVADFNDTVYANNGTWVQLTTSRSTFEQHFPAYVEDPKYMYVTNTVAYRYYAFKFADCWGNGYYMGLRRVNLQTDNVLNWATSTGGTPSSQNIPTASDTAVFDANSHNASYVVTGDSTSVLGGMTIGQPSSGEVTFTGQLNISANTTITGALKGNSTSSRLKFVGNGIATLNADGATIENVEFTGINGAGTNAPLMGTNIRDGGNNKEIAFGTDTSKYTRGL